MMTSSRNLHDQGPSAAADTPGDIPAERPAALDRLEALTGRWELEATFDAGFFDPGSPAVGDRGGRTTFDRLEGKSFLIQRFVN
jgi:hypothetical protein